MNPVTTTAAAPSATVVKAPRAPRVISTQKPAAKVATPAASKAAPAVKTAADAKPAPALKVAAQVKPAPAPVVKTQTTAPQQATTLVRGRGKSFSLIAGNVLAGINADAKKGLTRGLGYHVKQGNLTLAGDAYTLTGAGVEEWNADYVKNNPDMWRIIASFVKGSGEVPEMWSGHPPVQVAKGVRLPNSCYWGGFAKLNMRLAFRAMWAG